jgi:hypothetical protein
MLLRLDYFCKALTVLHDWKRLVATSVLTLAGWSVLSASLTMFTLSFGLKVSSWWRRPRREHCVGARFGRRISYLTVLALSVWVCRGKRPSQSACSRTA